MSVPSDHAVRLEALDSTQSFIVRAPAGSGKTGLLIQRYLALLAHVEEPEEVVAITFTIKAADEMRNRVLGALDSRGGADNDFETRTQALAQSVRERDVERGWQLTSQPGRLRILTIDALCLSLVRQMVWVSGVGGDIRPGEDAGELYRQAARNVFAHLTESDSGWTSVIETVLALLDNNVPRFETLLVSMLSRRDQWLRYLLAFSADPHGQRQHLEAVLGKLASDELRRITAILPPDLQRQLDAVGKGVGALEFDVAFPGSSASDLSAWQALASCVLTKRGEPRKRFGKQDGFPEDDLLKADARAVCETLAGLAELTVRLHATRALPEPCFSDDQWRRLTALVELLRVAVAELWLVFQATGEVDFIELVNRAKVALGEPEQPTDLALALDYRITHILVDEFQDTSLTQIDLLQRLTAGWQPGDGRTLLLVGDPMQSIYRFREADVGLYLEIRDHGLGAVPLRALTLETNFRSRPAVVEWVNDVFGKLLPMQDDVSAGAVAYTASRAQRGEDPESGASIHCLIDDDGSEEAALVVSLVRQVRRQHAEQTIAVLVRARAHLPKLLVGLREAGIAFRGVDLDPLRSMVVVQDLLALTRALAYPADRIAWFSIMRAPWCGLTLADLTILGKTPSGQTLLDSMGDGLTDVGLSSDGCIRVQRLHEVMRAALAFRGRCTWCRLVEETWLALGGPTATDEDGALNARAYFNLLERLDSRTGSLDMERLQRLVDKQFSIPPTGDGRVEIMTLHNAKGLEFDHVIVPSLEREPPANRKNVIEWTTRADSSGSRDLLVAPINSVGAPAETVYTYLRTLEATKVRNESARLLYVASTRAREHLHLIGNAKQAKIGVTKPSSDSLLARLWPLVEPAFETALSSRDGGAPQAAASPAGDDRGFPIHRLPAQWVSPVAAVYLTEPVRSVVDQPVEFDWAGAAARHIGTVVHQMLCLMSASPLSSWSSPKIDALVPRWRAILASQGVPADELSGATERVAQALKRVVTDTRGRWILSEAHAQARSEMPLTGVVDGVVVNAVLDRTFIDENDVRWIIDYKTGVHGGGHLDAFLDRERVRYQPQLERYAGLMAGLEVRATRLGLYFPLYDGWREWSAGETVTD